MRRETRAGVVFLGLFALVVGVYAAIPNNTLRNDWLVVTNFNVTGDMFYRGANVTAFIEAVGDWLENHTMPTPVWEETVEWGVVEGTTGDWFNHSLGYEPIYIGLQMHPYNLTIGGDYLYPNVYDKTNTTWQLEVVWMNNWTQCSKDVYVMYHMRWEPPLDGEDVDPNEPTKPNDPPL